MLDKVICSNCGAEIAQKVDGAVTFLPDGVRALATQSIENGNSTLMTTQCGNCECLLQFKT